MTMAATLSKVTIRNYKSLRDVSFDCRRINLFIGEPDSGKSNLLEAMAFAGGTDGLGGYVADLPTSKLVRMNLMYHLFHQKSVAKDIEIEWVYAVGGKNYAKRSTLRYDKNRDNFRFHSAIADLLMPVSVGDDGIGFDKEGRLTKNSICNVVSSQDNDIDKLPQIRKFVFDPNAGYSRDPVNELLSPHGENLFSIVFYHDEIRAFVEEFLKGNGYKLICDAEENRLKFRILDHDREDHYPYHLLSDTLRRMIFYHVCIRSAENRALLFEEPESGSFPYYTKQLGETIARDEKNQYFIATHNPYLLSAVLEKAQIDDVAVHVTRSVNGATEVVTVARERLGELLEIDPFFNLDSIVDDPGDAKP